MASKRELEDRIFELDGEGQGGFYRVPMTNRDGELNRHVMVNRGDKSLVTATLLDVVHGKMKADGDDATLLIASFLFLPADDQRFANANISWTFTSDDPAVEVEVVDIAPKGSWALNPVTLKLETTIAAKGNIGGVGGPVTANAGADYGRKAAKDLEYHTLVDGSMKVEERDYGGFDSARWNLKENVQHPRGICRMLQVGVLLKRTILSGKKPRPGPLPTFRGAVDITVEKGASNWTHAKSALRRAWKKMEKDEAIVFRPDTDLVSEHFDIEKDNLGVINLTDDIMYMSLHESFEEVRKERQERKKKWEDSEKSKQQQEEEDKKQQDEAETKRHAVAAVAAGTSTLAQSQGGGRDTSSANGPSAWLLYVVLGMLGMYFWQQLAKALLGGN
jgi:hypothetical protein